MAGNARYDRHGESSIRLVDVNTIFRIDIVEHVALLTTTLDRVWGHLLRR